MNIILTSALSTITGTVIGILINMIRNYKKQNDDIRDSVKSILRSEITCIYYGIKARGYVLRWEKENILYLYNSYKKLNGNSYVETIIEEVQELPLKYDIQ